MLLDFAPGSRVDISQYGSGLQLISSGRTARLVDESGALVATGDTQIDDDVVLGLIDSGRRSVSIIALDTSVAVPLLVQAHSAHSAVVAWWRGRGVALSGHALVETYSVLTRVRLAAAGAGRLLSERFRRPVTSRSGRFAKSSRCAGRLRHRGGAVYDAIVALAAAKNGYVLATPDARAKIIYDAIGLDDRIRRPVGDKQILNGRDVARSRT